MSLKALCECSGAPGGEKEVRQYIAAELERIGCPYEMASLYGKISSEHNYHEKEYSCMAGYSTIYIDWNGDVFPCVYMKNKAFLP